MPERSEYEQEIHRMLKTYREVAAGALSREINEETISACVNNLFWAIEHGLIVISRQIEGRPPREA